jgi:4-amino-4-deoxy-L-arabinose transferase-like glycosyltransferase
MWQKLFFIAQQYSELLAFVVGAWGYGQLVLKPLIRRNAFTDPLLSHCICVAAGLGVMICALQAMAVAGQLHAIGVFLLVAIGWVFAMLKGASAGAFSSMEGISTLRRPSLQAAAKFAVPSLLFAMTIFKPLQPPTSCDELMYHLPHAQQWALTGSLTVDEWLRYPWFPFNYELLYAAALLTVGDVMPHLLHALAGWLVFLLIYRVGVLQVGQVAGIVAASLWLVLVGGDFNTAYIDMGLTLFVFCACVVFNLWLDARQDSSLLVLAAFFLGVAVGTKYQALIFVPFFAISVLWRQRRIAVLTLAAACFLIPCIYWYARNFLITGDPFSPFGGKIFGFADWNLDDYNAQFSDLHKNRGLPNPWVWPALLVVAVAQWRRLPAVRRALIFAAYALATWVLTSSYPRYLMPVFPVLALLAGHGLWSSALATIKWVETSKGAAVSPPSNRALYVFIGVLAIAAAFPTYRSWKRVAVTTEDRAQVIDSSLTGYGAIRFLAQQPYSKIYELGVEYAIYYLPQPIWGEVFGPWRDRDFVGTPREMHAKLTQLGFQTLLINVLSFPGVIEQPDFSDYFSETYSDGIVHVYGIRDRTLLRDAQIKEAIVGCGPATASAVCPPLHRLRPSAQ